MATYTHRLEFPRAVTGPFEARLTTAQGDNALMDTTDDTFHVSEYGQSVDEWTGVYADHELLEAGFPISDVTAVRLYVRLRGRNVGEARHSPVYVTSRLSDDTERIVWTYRYPFELLQVPKDGIPRDYFINVDDRILTESGTTPGNLAAFCTILTTQPLILEVAGYYPDLPPVHERVDVCAAWIELDVDSEDPGEVPVIVVPSLAPWSLAGDVGDTRLSWLRGRT